MWEIIGYLAAGLISVLASYFLGGKVAEKRSADYELKELDKDRREHEETKEAVSKLSDGDLADELRSYLRK